MGGGGDREAKSNKGSGNVSSNGAHLFPKRIICYSVYIILLDDLKEKRRYWKLKEEAQDRTLWRTQFGRGY
jgi:hypothetical protein